MSAGLLLFRLLDEVLILGELLGFLYCHLWHFSDGLTLSVIEDFWYPDIFV